MKKNDTDTKNILCCASCGVEFKCDPKNIKSCECTKISLSDAEKIFIGTKFNSCLCNSCLLNLKQELSTHIISKGEKKKTQNFLGYIFATLFFICQTLSSQTYHPAAGQPGSTAMRKDSSVFINWAKACSVLRGYQDKSNQSLGFATVGDESMATGKALSNGVVSLGDGGSAICTFNYPIRNGQGFDLAIFENSIDDSFLELAFVEVSSDGINYFRFKSHSLSDTLNQTTSFGSTDATKINNLAGKYRAGFGTPFDLQELAGISGLDIDAITHVKLTDVIGSLNNLFAGRDGYNNKVNDPWPTPFPSSGFDLDAIGVIHENRIVGIKELEKENEFVLFPNPVESSQVLNLFIGGLKKWTLLTLSQQEISTSFVHHMQLPELVSGIYLVKIETTSHTFYRKVVLN